MLELINDEVAIGNDIEQADEFKDKIYTALVKIEKVCMPAVTPQHPPLQ